VTATPPRTPAFALAILAGAFLLFQVQPLIAKYVLPWFGGGPAVWSAAMLVFQVLLLVGYAYAHLSTARLSPRGQATLHAVVVLGALAFLPIVPAVSWKPDPGDAPTLEIVGLLVATIGLPYLAVASTSPLLQAWLSRLRPERTPYRLYALSNLGSLLALISFPFLVEPMFARRTQALIWSWSFTVFVALSLACAWRVWKHGATTTAAASPGVMGEGDVPGRFTRFLWIGLPCVASMLLLAVTNQISQDIAVIPFLWVLPLSLYLLTFIIAFDHDRWYYRPVFLGLLVPAMGAVVWVMARGVDAAILAQIGVYSGVLFVCAMACHGELVRLKPPTKYLTRFYLTIAAGGALGGAFVALVAPVIFRGFWELHVGLVACCALILLALLADPTSALGRWPRLIPVGFVVWWGFVLAIGWQAGRSVTIYDTVDRNFYGVIRTEVGFDADFLGGEEFRVLYHGGINHGFQYLGEASSRAPRSYFGRLSGVALAARHLPKPAGRRIGVIGLGVGTMAAFAHAGDEIRFYEINPIIESHATTLFRYLSETEADWDVVLGDGRLSLERELAESGGAGRGYDLLVMDAFSGDAPPVHLLTREAFALYRAHLAADGLLVFNVSNRHIDMSPVIWGLAAEFGMQAVLIEDEDDDAAGIFASSWMVVTNNLDWLEHPEVQVAIAAVPENEEPDTGRIRLWTDEYSNIFQLLY
jgi:hypothetical protein